MLSAKRPVSALVEDEDRPATPAGRARWRLVWAGLWPRLLAVATAVAVWQIVVWTHWRPSYVLPGPLPRETIHCLLDLDIPAQFIRGNGDREVLAQMSGVETDWYRTAPEQWREPVRWTAQQLDTQHQQLLEGWPPTSRVEIPGLGDVLFCHATPHNDTEIITRLTPDDRLLPIFGGLGVSLVVCGHTRIQFDRMIGTTRVVNAGSVGMAFGEPGADWLLLGPDVELRHTADGNR